MAIRKRGNKFVVTNRKGDKVLGTHNTKGEAVAQLRAIEISKKQRAAGIIRRNLR